jgi:trimeric autotransporter adhesin
VLIKKTLKMKNLNRIFCFVLLCEISFSAFSQNVGINTTGATPSTNAILDLNSGNSRNLGVIFPHVTLGASLTTFSGPIAHAATTADSGLVVYNSSSAHQTIGYYYWNGTTWVSLGGSGAGTTWSLTGNTGTTPGTNYLGTSDGEALEFKADGQKAGWLDYASPYNTCLGYQTMNSLGVSATHCTALGYEAMGGSSGSPSDVAVGYYALYSSNNNTGHNIAIGDSALSQNSNPANSIAIGHQAMSSNNSGTGYDVGIGYQVMTGVANGTAAHDVGIGYQALYEQQSNYNVGIGEQTLYYGSAQYSVGLGYQAFGSPTYSASPLYSIGIGYQALYGGSKATSGSNDIAIGYQAMYGVGAGNNIAIGYQSIYGNGSTTGTFNIAMGYQSLYAITTGGYNIAIGDSVLNNGTSTKGNTAMGDGALASTTTGYFNTAVGYQALQNDVSLTTSAENTAIGASALSSNTTGSNNTAIGFQAGNLNTTGAENTYLGYNAGNNASLNTINNVVCLGYNSGNGAATIASNNIYMGNSSTSKIYCVATSITTYSDRRVKDSIKENVPGLAFITRLRPVTYHLNIHKENNILGIKDDKDYPGKYDIEKITQSGFIAQQVDSAAQACGYNFSGLDNPKTSNGLYALNYTTFVVPLVKAVQEQQQMIEEHTKTINELKEEVELLKQKVGAVSAASTSVPPKK